MALNGYGQHSASRSLTAWRVAFRRIPSPALFTRIHAVQPVSSSPAGVAKGLQGEDGRLSAGLREQRQAFGILSPPAMGNGSATRSGVWCHPRSWVTDPAIEPRQALPPARLPGGG